MNPLSDNVHIEVRRRSSATFSTTRPSSRGGDLVDDRRAAREVRSVEVRVGRRIEAGVYVL